MRESLDSDIKAILFDLDGTLLAVNLDLFIQQYLKLLSESLAHFIAPKKLIPCLLKASAALDKNDGTKTNEKVFEEIFFPLIGYKREEIEPIFDNFYDQVFPELRRYTRRKPEARSVVQLAFDRGIDVVIATTPLLPETAIVQRLEWAGVPVTDFPFRLITTFENSRANKPNIIYYKQILEEIGHPAERCLMVGDEDKDMMAANLGLKTFLVLGSNKEFDPNTPEPNYRGTLADLEKLLKIKNNNKS